VGNSLRASRRIWSASPRPASLRPRARIGTTASSHRHSDTVRAGLHHCGRLNGLGRRTTFVLSVGRL